MIIGLFLIFFALLLLVVSFLDWLYGILKQMHLDIEETLKNSEKHKNILIIERIALLFFNAILKKIINFYEAITAIDEIELEKKAEKRRQRKKDEEELANLIFSFFEGKNKSPQSSTNQNNYTTQKNSDYSYEREIIEYKQIPKEPYVKLYEAIKESIRTGKRIKYAYGTYVENGKLYNDLGIEILNKEDFFKDKENEYIKNHGYDKEYMKRKAEHKEKVDEYLKWKKEIS